MNNKEFDQDKDFQLLHDKYLLESTELPPDSVDAKLLQAAHQAVDSHELEQSEIEKNNNSKILNKYVKRAWYVPMSYVAVMVLSLSVVLKFAFEPDTTVNEVIDSRFMESDFAEDEQRKADEKTLIMSDMKMRQARKMSEKSDQRKQKKVASSAARAKVRAVEERKKLSRAPVSAPSASLPVSQSHQYMESDAEVSRGITSMPVMSQAVSEEALDTGGAPMGHKEAVLAKSQQKNEQDVLITLYQTGQFEKLRLAMKDYRKKYPLSVNDMALPQALLDLEIRWEKENTSKILHD
ncbi:MAG: hypothetical protein DIZ80_15380 [endosymbiont of Galathealinum brachiosum]|uniref:Uncharacterized protein n=1 Tax=endosymbiont of Galathealinum brachiosum TaxID=2200906 RepID=A0A370D975_9GAMM|nr:MAG: hypothetical protein DIZ80_15380 [endosymbiont of Galathealinum brachiosum]